MTTMASQITSLTVVYSTINSDADQRKHQSSALLAFVWGIHRDQWIPRTKGQLRGKCFHLMSSSWKESPCVYGMDLVFCACGFPCVNLYDMPLVVSDISLPLSTLAQTHLTTQKILFVSYFQLGAIVITGLEIR